MLRGFPNRATGHRVHSWRRLFAFAGMLLLAAATAFTALDAVAGSGSAARPDLSQSAAPISLVRVVRRAVRAQTSVTGTLGYSGSWTVVLAAASSGSDLRQAEQQEAVAAATVLAARAAATGDAQALVAARAALRSERAIEARACANPASGGPDGASGTNPDTQASVSASADGAVGAAAGPCASSVQTVIGGRVAVATAQARVAVDEAQLAGARGVLASVHRAVAAARGRASSFGDSGSYTMLPAPGEVFRRGQALYAINGVPALLFYGGTPAWRGFAAGMSPGRDVAELNANLRALGFDASVGGTFTGETAQAVAALQRAHGLGATGVLPLGSVVFEPAAARVTSVAPTLGAAAEPGPIMTLSSTKHEVVIQLDASQQSEVTAGDRVTVSLPDNSTTLGVVASVSAVATTPANDQNNGGQSATTGPTITVDVQLLHPAAAGTLDQAPVSVLITTDSVRDALVVPVDALLARAGGGYALEEVSASGTHRLVAVTPGLFDDQQGIVQVTGHGLAAGQRVVVPAST